MLKEVEIGFTNKSGVPDMDYTIDSLVDIIDYEGNKKHNSVACHYIKVAVVNCNLDRLALAAGDLGHSHGNISKITGSYIVMEFYQFGN